MWQLLGLAPTTDEDAVRSAFRDRMLALRRAGRHQDLDAVQPLRQAYERALRWVQQEADRAAQGAQPVTARDQQTDADPTSATDGKDAGTPNDTPLPDARAAQRQPDAPPPIAQDELTLSTTALRGFDVMLGDEPVHAVGPTAADIAAAQAMATLQAERAVQQLLGQGLVAHLCRRIHRLRRQPHWQRPHNAQALQAALAQRLLSWQPRLASHQAAGIPFDEAMRQAQRWLALALDCADHWRWWPMPPNGHLAIVEATGALWPALCQTAVDWLITLIGRQSTPSACDAFAHLLNEPVMQVLDNRAEWLALFSECLAACPKAPASLVSLVLRAQDAEHMAPGEHSDPRIEALLLVHQALLRSSLLQRIAAGRLDHEHISLPVAQALLRPRISCADRRAVRKGELLHGGRSWLLQMRESIAWLHEHAPDALGPTAPAVLRWWRAPHLLAQDWWESAAMLGGTAGGTAAAALVAVVTSPNGGREHQALTVVVLLAGIALCSVLGWQLGVGLSWLRMKWSTWLYPAWRRSDARLVRRVPLFGPLLQFYNIWLSRDLLVIGLLLQRYEIGQWQPWLTFAIWRLGLRLASGGTY